ncbi:hypothetical protein SSYM_2458, partial [Serratia symbiotica str. Tucson]
MLCQISYNSMEINCIFDLTKIRLYDTHKFLVTIRIIEKDFVFLTRRDNLKTILSLILC